MATFKYFYDGAGQTIELDEAGGLDNATFAARWPGIKGKRLDSFTRRVGYVKGVRSPLAFLPITRAIEFKRNPSLHKCDGRCMSARGHICECSCRGKNHGAGAFSCQPATLI